MIMNVLWTRLTEGSARWRHAYKACALCFFFHIILFPHNHIYDFQIIMQLFIWSLNITDIPSFIGESISELCNNQI
jgi:hypothetical protein